MTLVDAHDNPVAGTPELAALAPSIGRHDDGAPETSPDKRRCENDCEDSVLSVPDSAGTRSGGWCASTAFM